MNIEELESILLGLLKGQHSSLRISFNEDNGPNYQTVAECADDHYWVSEEEKQKGSDTNRMWEIQWYPDSPVGSHSIAASSLEALLAYVRAG